MSHIELPSQPPRPAALRVTGPGRLERRYQGRIAELEAATTERASELEGARRELETAQLIERGTGRLVERVEGDLRRERAAAEEARQQGRRVMVALGALQRENQRLAADLASARTRLQRIEAAPPPGLWTRLLGAGRRKSTPRA